MLQILENNHDYVQQHQFTHWEFCVFHLSEYIHSKTSEPITLINWIDHPFLYECGKNLAFGYLPIDAAKQCCDELNSVFQDQGYFVILEVGITPVDLSDRIHHPDEIWLSMIFFDLIEVDKIMFESEHNLASDESEHLDFLLDLILERGLEGLSPIQKLTLERIARK